MLDKYTLSLFPHPDIDKSIKSLKSLFTPPLGDIVVLSIGIRARSLLIRLHRLESKMSTSGIVHNDTFDFDGTNYHLWRIRMICHFRTMGPNVLRIVIIGAHIAEDCLSPSLEDMHIDSDALVAIHQAISFDVSKSILMCKTAHEAWTKLDVVYGGSYLDETNIFPMETIGEVSTTSYREEHPIASTSNYLGTSTSSTLPTCFLSQGNDMVSGKIMCDNDVEITIDDHPCRNASIVSSMDLSISCTNCGIDSSVNSPCIPSNDSLTHSCDDMPDLLCCHDINASISSSYCMTNRVEEIKKNVAHLINEEPSSSEESSPTPFMHMCLMARGNHEVSSSLSDNDDDCDENDDDMTQNLYEIGKTLCRVNKSTYRMFQDVLAFFDERNDLLHEVQDKNELLEHNIILAHQSLRDLSCSKEEIEIAHCKLKEDFEHLDLGHKNVKEVLTKLSRSHEELQATHEKSLVSTSSSHVVNNACTINPILCEASILKENGELSAQLDSLTSNYGKLEVIHEKLSSTHEDLLNSHDRLKLAHEAMVTKVKYYESHVDISTYSTQNAILPCANPCNLFTHNVATSCDELLSLPCCSNNEASTSSSSCVDTNHVEEIKELKAQVTSLKKDLVKGHEGKSTLDKVLCGQKSPNDKDGLEFNSNNKKSMINKKKGQTQVKNSAKIVCFKCKNEGHHVRSCPLKKKPLSDKQLGKRPQVQPLGEKRPILKKTQVNDLHVEKSTKKKGKSRCCYLCREKGHLASSCTNGTLSNPITVDNYLLRKDNVGNVFAKCGGTQSGVKKCTIWVAKLIVTNLLGPNLVGDQQAPT